MIREMKAENSEIQWDPVCSPDGRVWAKLRQQSWETHRWMIMGTGLPLLEGSLEIRISHETMYSLAQQSLGIYAKEITRHPKICAWGIPPFFPPSLPSFPPQIFVECSLCSKHCFRLWIYSSEPCRWKSLSLRNLNSVQGKDNKQDKYK